MPVKLGELLLKENMVTPQQLQEALNHQKMGGGKLGKAFVSLGFVKDEEITALQALMTSVLPYDSHPYLQEGMKVEVVRGPLQGVQGILLRKDKRHRLILGVRLIQQAAAVEIDTADVVPLQ